MSATIPRRPTPLPAIEPRCEPTQPCTMQPRCARACSTVIADSRLKDYSTESGGGTALCYGYYNLNDLLTRGPSKAAAIVDGEEEQG